MYFKFDCSNCGKKLKSPEERVGLKATCPYCKATVTVPSPSMIDINIDTVDRNDAPTEEHQGASSGTNVSLLWSGLYGLGATIIVCILLYPFRSTYIGELVLDRGWVPYVLVFLVSWSGAILFLKSQKLRRQKSAMLFDLLPTELGEDITPDKIDAFRQHIRKLPADPGESFVITRVLRGLDHFRVRKNSSEVASILQSQSDIDANAVDSSYTILKVFIWAIPILGFIGTVIGISAAVGGFSGTLEGASDISALKESLNSVTGGLATAFDTTLVALVFSLIVTFSTSGMQKSEEDLLNSVDEYCNENLIKRLSSQTGEQTAGWDQPNLKAAITAALAEQQAELEAWSKRLETVGETVTKTVRNGWADLEKQIAEKHARRIADHEKLVAKTAAEQQTQAKQLAEVQQTQTKVLAENSTRMGDSFEQMSQGLTKLANLLTELNGKQVVVEQHVHTDNGSERSGSWNPFASRRSRRRR